MEEQHFIDQLAAMARLELSEEERAPLSAQIASILEYVATIAELDLPPDAPVMAHVGSEKNVWREDVVISTDVSTHRALVAAFPEEIEHQNAVPAVFDRKK